MVCVCVCMMSSRRALCLGFCVQGFFFMHLLPVCFLFCSAYGEDDEDDNNEGGWWWHSTITLMLESVTK